MTLYITNAALVQGLAEAALLAHSPGLWPQTTLHLNVGALGDRPWTEVLGMPVSEVAAQRAYLRSFIETSSWPLNEDADIMDFFQDLMTAIATKQGNRASTVAQGLMPKHLAALLPPIQDRKDDASSVMSDDSESTAGHRFLPGLAGGNFNRPFEFDAKLQNMVWST